MTKRILIVTILGIIISLGYVSLYKPVRQGRALYRKYLSEKFMNAPNVVSEEYHYHLFIGEGVTLIGVVWTVDAGQQGVYDFTTLNGILSVDGEQVDTKLKGGL